MASKVPNPKEHPLYLVITPMETLLEDGLIFDGEAEKDRVLNQTDFLRLREILQRFDPNLTADLRETLLRSLKCCVKEPA